MSHFIGKFFIVEEAFGGIGVFLQPAEQSVAKRTYHGALHIVHVAVYESRHDEGVDVGVNVALLKLRIAGRHFGVIAGIDYYSVLYYHQTVGEIVIAFVFVMEKRISFKRKNLTANCFYLASVGLEGNR